MSTGVFLSIKESYAPDSVDVALSLVGAVNRVLDHLHQQALQDPDEGPHVCQGRTSADSCGSSTLAKLGELAGQRRAHAQLLAQNPYRLVYAPRDLEEPQVTDHREDLGGDEVPILLGSSWGLLRDLQAIAPELGIPLNPDATLSDAVAKKLNRQERLGDVDEAYFAMANLRSGWLLMHEAALLSIRHDVAICLAG